MSQHHYQMKSWTDSNCHAVWRFEEFRNVCKHLLQQRQLRISTHRANQSLGCCSTRAQMRHATPVLFSGRFWRLLTRLPSSSHKCSICYGTGDNADQGRTRMWFWKSWQTRATCHLALLKDMIRVSLLQKGQSDRIKYIVYFTAFNVLWTIVSWLRPLWQIPAQTITLQPPKRSDSYTHWSVKHSLRPRYTR